MLTQDDIPIPGKRSTAGSGSQNDPPTMSGQQPSTMSSSSSTPVTKQGSTSKSSSLSSGDKSTRPVATPPKRRLGAPSMIPNFPGANEVRSSNSGQISSSPIRSPGPASPITSPPTPSTPLKNIPSFKLPSFSQPFQHPGQSDGTPQSPWQILGATSGAPTPSLDGPGRSSPHLGGPFEQLNLNGSWSGANLWAEGSGGETTPARSSRSGSGSGMNADMLAKYRNMAGRASASGTSGRSPIMAGNAQVGDSSMDGVESTPPSSSPVLKPSLPAALARRRGSLPKAGLGLLSPPTQHPVKSPLGSTSIAMPSPSVPARGPRPLAASDMPAMMSRSSTLILDVRPPSAYLAGHLNDSHSIPIPSTLLRRPAFSIAKVLLMLSPSSRDAVGEWKSKTNIVIIDADSTTAAEGSLIEGLSSKFERVGFGGKLWFVKGGQEALEANHDIDIVSSTPQDAEAMSSTGPAPQSPSGEFSAGGLGAFAFHQGSTGSGQIIPRTLSGTPTTPMPNPFESAALRNTRSNSSDRPLSLKGMMLGDMGSARNSSIGSFSSSLSGKSKMQPANPFFDNIRQNLELSHGGITERISLQLPADARRRAHELPAWLSELVALDDTDAAEKLAQQFYTVERNEQKRLQALMDWHTQGSGMTLPATTKEDTERNSWTEQKNKDQADVRRLEQWRNGQGSSGNQQIGEYYPFSITAGVERGSKNRYKNIWPYDFSRVRLVTPSEDQSDYINASYIQPRGTSRRYIATQGPLDATFRDFWTIVWEQNVRVIVMLTKQFEGGQTKCGNYWQDQHFGPLHLHLDKQSGGQDYGRPTQASGFDFGLPPTSSTDDNDKDGEAYNIRREFHLSHDGHPSDPPRKIVQLQCVTWPDFDVPTLPDVLLALIRDVDEAIQEVTPPPVDDQPKEIAPIVVHCSAGIGRTGSYILVDSVLDALARERQTGQQHEDEIVTTKVQRVPAMSESTPPPSAQDGAHRDHARAGSYSSRSGSGSPKGAGGSLDSGRSRGHSGRGKSVSFNTGNKIVMPGMEDDDVDKKNTDKDGRSRATSLPASNKGLQSLDWVPAGEMPAGKPDAMEVDSPFEYPPPPSGLETQEESGDNQWMTYRDDKDGQSEAGTNMTGRRPSLVSAFTSEEKLSDDKLSSVNEEHPLQQIDRQRSPTPLSDMENPVLDVLESMRVQRMSLVQSLRQFVFAYKVIVHQYFAMLDEETDHPKSRPTPRLHNPIMEELEDDDSNPKRRASPTELIHDRPGMDIDDDEDRQQAGELHSGGKGRLGRKLSVKRMKQEVKPSSPIPGPTTEQAGDGSSIAAPAG